MGTVSYLPRRRPKQAELATGICNHETTEEVVTYGGEVIAVRCATCTHIVCHIGVCDGCGEKRNLYHHVPTRKKRFHNVDCYRAWQSKRNKERREAVRELIKGIK